MSKNKTAYLTIDDSPSPDFMEKVNFLRDKNIPAVFFCIGEKMEADPQSVIEAIQCGYIIANHSYTHPSFSDISIEQAREEITKTDRLIDELYLQAGVKRPAKWFRFPYGDKGDKKYGRVFSWLPGSEQRKKDIQDILIELGYTQPKFENVTYQFMRKADLFKDRDWSWSFDIMEWSLMMDKPVQGLYSIEDVLKRMRENNPKDCRGSLWFEKKWLCTDSAEIILLHDHEETSAYFYRIVNQLKDLPLIFKNIE